MKRTLFLLISFCSFHMLHAQVKMYENDSMFVRVEGHDTTWIEKPFRSGNTKFVYVDDPKAYPSYKEDITSFIQKNLRYPEDAREKKIQGTVRVDVHINENGKIDDSMILHSVSPSVDAEALRVVLLMKDWNPSEMSGKVFAMWRTVEVPFKLK